MVLVTEFCVMASAQADDTIFEGYLVNTFGSGTVEAAARAAIVCEFEPTLIKYPAASLETEAAAAADRLALPKRKLVMVVTVEAVAVNVAAVVEAVEVATDVARGVV